MTAKEIAEKLRRFLKYADGLDKWNGYGEGYSGLRAELVRLITELEFADDLESNSPH